jgi:hypothetical protein
MDFSMLTGLKCRHEADFTQVKNDNLPFIANCFRFQNAAECQIICLFFHNFILTKNALELFWSTENNIAMSSLIKMLFYI